MTAAADPNKPTLWLPSAGLLQKWGFQDAEEPWAFQDWREARGVTVDLDWHAVLERLVRDHLLPVLDQRVEVVTIPTAHNPIRAERVDGVDVHDHWYDPETPSLLTPDGVSVPYTVVLATVRDQIAAASTPRVGRGDAVDGSQ